ncbi:MAG: hypothetical protein QXV08_01325 [Desulfurococcus sp.]|uniref:hypothetical protein n=1 Tax=Desulfurococcus sp. TaxID=51678 RepID=UPI003176A5CD
MMHVEDIFKALDNLLGLTNTPVIIILMLSFAVFFFTSFLLLWLGRVKDEKLRDFKNGAKTRRGHWLNNLVLLSIVVLVIGYVQSIVLLSVSWLLVAGLVLSAITLVLISADGSNYVSVEKLLILIILFAAVFSSHVIINGVEGGETTTDTLQIYIKGYFRFSRHAGWYDLAPVDAIVKNFVLYSAGVNNPYDPLTTTIIFTALGISVIIYLLTYVKTLRGNGVFDYFALAVILMAVNPYSLLIGMSSPPTNFSLVFSLLAVLVIARHVATSAPIDYRTLILVAILAVSATLAHPKAIMILLYVSSILVTRLFVHRGRGDDLTRRLISLLIIVLVIYSLKALYTATAEGLKGVVDMILNGLTDLLFGMEFRDVNVYLGSSMPPPRSTLVSFATFPAFLSAVFLVELLRFLRRGDADADTIVVTFVVLLASFFALVTNIVYSASRYLGYPALVLGGFQTLTYLMHAKIRPTYKKTIIILLGVMCILSILSPNSLIEQYNVFTGGRWARVENFILTRELFEMLDYSYVASVFNGFEEAKLTLYLPQDILLYGHPYHHVECLIVERILIPGIVNARSYWDFYSGNRMFLRSEYLDSPNQLANTSIIFSGWKWVLAWKQ